MSRQRTWVIEGWTDSCGWWALPGHLYDNKRLAFYGLRSVREQFKGDYPKSNFKLTEYIRKES